jgi:Xaa-Pro aminopeptidase
MESKKRISNLQKLLNQEGSPAAMLISSQLIPQSVLKQNSNELTEKYENNNYQYLVGELPTDCLLLVSNRDKTPMLFVKKNQNKKTDKNISKSAKNIGAKIEYFSSNYQEVISSLKGISSLYSGTSQKTISGKIAQKIMNEAVSPARLYPLKFNHSELLMSELRLIKSKSEVKLIASAIDKTSIALKRIQPFIKAGVSEKTLHQKLLKIYSDLNCQLAFNPIVANTKSASIPHYRNLRSKLKSNEYVLIDSGADLNNYLSDITRVFPVQKKFTAIQKEQYTIVHEALLAAIKEVKPGNELSKSSEAADKILIYGLKQLGLLSGKIETIQNKRLHLPYTRHALSHSLGMNVHDCTYNRQKLLQKYQEGMVITIEPGLYLQKNTEQLKAFGMRLEENILVTKTGAKILSDNIPIKINEVEQMREQ